MISAVYIASTLDYLYKQINSLDVNLFPEMSYCPELSWEDDKTFHKILAVNTIGPDLDAKVRSWQDNWSFLQWSKGTIQRPEAASEMRPFCIRYENQANPNLFVERPAIIGQFPVTIKITTNNPLFAETIEAWSFLDMSLLVNKSINVEVDVDYGGTHQFTMTLKGQDNTEMERLTHTGEDYLYSVGFTVLVTAPIISLNYSLYPKLKDIIVRLWTQDYKGIVPEDPVRVWTLPQNP